MIPAASQDSKTQLPPPQLLSQPLTFTPVFGFPLTLCDRSAFQNSLLVKCWVLVWYSFSTAYLRSFSVLPVPRLLSHCDLHFLPEFQPLQAWTHCLIFELLPSQSTLLFPSFPYVALQATCSLPASFSLCSWVQTTLEENSGSPDSSVLRQIFLFAFCNLLRPSLLSVYVSLNEVVHIQSLSSSCAPLRPLYPCPLGFQVGCHTGTSESMDPKYDFSFYPKCASPLVGLFAQVSFFTLLLSDGVCFVHWQLSCGT